MGVVLVCDLGGSSLRSALIDATGQILAQHRIHCVVPSPQSGFSEIDPQLWWQDVVHCIEALHAQDSSAFASVQGLAFCGFTRTQVFIGHDGSVLRPAITWQDTRADQSIADLQALLPIQHPETGQINAFHPLARLHWIRQNEAALFGRLSTVLDPKDFIAFRLTGSRKSDPISMARLYAASKPGEDGRTLFEATDLPDQILPELASPLARIGCVQSGLGGALERLAGKPVFNGCNDTWAAVLGLGAMRSGMAYNISGTTEVFGVLHEDKATAEGLLSVDWGGLHQLGGPGQNGADTISWLLALMDGHEQKHDVGAALSQLLENPRDPQPLLFLPYLNGERVPYWDPALRGAFVGLNRRHGAVDMAYAVLEGTAFYNRIILERAEAATGVAVHEIRFGGGAAANPVWRQLKADICGRPVSVVQTQETGLLGCAALAWTGLGQFPSLDAAQQAMVKTLSRSEPDPERGIFYDALYDQFRRAEEALSPLSAALSKMTLMPSHSRGI